MKFKIKETTHPDHSFRTTINRAIQHSLSEAEEGQMGHLEWIESRLQLQAKTIGCILERLAERYLSAEELSEILNLGGVNYEVEVDTDIEPEPLQ